MNDTLEVRRAQLLRWLDDAFLLELGTIPPYLTAMISLRPETNRTTAELIRAVAIEEMLHMTLVANVINSLGGTVTIGPDTIPSYPFEFTFEGKQFKDRRFKVGLKPFSANVLDTFMQIELPHDWPSHDRLALMAIDHLEVDGLTIGDFYHKIIREIEELCRYHGERSVFVGDPARQIGEDYYWSSGGRPVVVTDLDSMKLALDTVVEQGEGTSRSIDADNAAFGQSEDLAHFFRFREIHFARHYQAGDTPHEPPTGSPFTVDYTQVYPMLDNPRDSDYPPGSAVAQLNDEFNEEYTLMLTQLQSAFGGVPKDLYTAMMNGMHNLASLAGEMARTAIADHPLGKHGTPTFSWKD